MSRRKPPTRTVTVCAACRTEACWRGEMFCEDYRTAGTVEVEVPDAACRCCAAIAQARREAAEEMRERCVAACESRRAKHSAAADEQWSLWDDNMAIVDLADEAWECAEAIRALEETP